MTVAYLGLEGTYTQSAVAKHFGAIPAENSTKSLISSTLDCLVNSNLKV